MSPSPSTSIAYTDIAPSAFVDITCSVKLCDPSFSYHAILLRGYFKTSAGIFAAGHFAKPWQRVFVTTIFAVAGTRDERLFLVLTFAALVLTRQKKKYNTIVISLISVK